MRPARPKSPSRGSSSISWAPDGCELDKRRSDIRRPRTRRGASPGPRLARKRPTGVSSPVGETSSTRPAPTSTDAASTPSLGERRRCSTSRAKSRRYVSHRLVEVDDRDTEMMDSSHLHGAIAIRPWLLGRVGDELGASATSRTVPTVSDERDSGITSRAASCRARRGRASPSRASAARDAVE